MFDPAKKQHIEPGIPLELLQWWLFILEFDDRVERNFSKEELEHIENFNTGLDRVRDKQLGTSKARDLQDTRKTRAKKDLADKVFFIEVVKHVRHSVEAYEEVESVQIYKRLLMDDMRTRQADKRQERRRQSGRPTPGRMAETGY